jgi:hypothetical protein
MLTLSCLCGAVQLQTATRPAVINECNCSLCSKSGARWAYYHPDDVVVTGETHGFRRADKDDPAAEVRFCPRCGSTSHFILTPSAVARFGNVQMGLNMSLADEADLAGAELHFPDGRAWPGAGDFSYVREARIIGG